MTKPELEDKIVGLLGGRVSEEVNFGEVSTGAHNDFQRSTSIARKMVTEYGMSDKLGPLQFGESGGGQVFLGRDMQSDQNYSDKIAYEIDQEMQNIVKTQYERCRQILTDHKEQLVLIAETLLEIETLDREQIEGLFYDGKLPERKYEDHTADDSEDEKIGKSYDEVKKEVDDKDEPHDSEDRGEDNRELEERPDMAGEPEEREDNARVDEQKRREEDWENNNRRD